MGSNYPPRFQVEQWVYDRPTKRFGVVCVVNPEHPDDMYGVEFAGGPVMYDQGDAEARLEVRKHPSDFPGLKFS